MTHLKGPTMTHFKVSRITFDRYGVATMSRLLKIVGLFLQNIVSFVGLFCKRDL